jgi:hypothetical protein
MQNTLLKVAGIRELMWGAAQVERLFGGAGAGR